MLTKQEFLAAIKNQPSFDVVIHEDRHIGATFGGQTWSHLRNITGEMYWRVEEEIGSIFGYQVDGSLKAFGRTKEEAMARLQIERDNLSRSLWE